MSHLVSHVFLLALFIVSIVYPPIIPPPECWLYAGWCEGLLLSWLCGMLLSQLSQTAENTGLAWIRVFLLVISATALICHLFAVAFQLNHNFLAWILLCNIQLAVEVAVGFIQLLEFLMLHHLFGPWAIIIKNLMKDLRHFAIILLLFHTTFSLSLTAICQPVPPETRHQCNYSVNSSNNNVSEPVMTPLNVCFALFCSLWLNRAKGHLDISFRPHSYLDSSCLWNLSGGDGDSAAQPAHCHDEQHIPEHPVSVGH